MQNKGQANACREPRHRGDNWFRNLRDCRKDWAIFIQQLALCRAITLETLFQVGAGAKCAALAS